MPESEININATIHSFAVIEENVSIGKNVIVWHFSHIRSGAKVLEDVSIGKSVFID